MRLAPRPELVTRPAALALVLGLSTACGAGQSNSVGFSGSSDEDTTGGSDGTTTDDGGDGDSMDSSGDAGDGDTGGPPIPCTASAECPNDMICGADYSPGDDPAFLFYYCMAECFMPEDDVRWCKDDAACCDGNEICTEFDGYCEPAPGDGDGDGDGDGTSGDGDGDGSTGDGDGDGSTGDGDGDGTT